MGGMADASRQTSNRRTAFRLPTALDVRVQVEGTPKGTEIWPLLDGGTGRVLATVSEDISAGGLRFRAPTPLARRTPVTLAFALDETPVVVEAEVAHVEADDFGAGIGTAFTSIDALLTSRLVRYITARERIRLPIVPIMYTLQCHVGGTNSEFDGATEACSPTFVRLLLSRSVRPGDHLTIVVNVGRTEMRLAGRAVSCRPADQLWRTEVELVELAEPIAAPWRDLVVRLRDASR